MILVSGDALFDFFLEAEASPSALSFEARAGGSPLNVAIGLARLGGEAGFFSAFSKDLLGTRLRKVLAVEGVDTRYALTTDRLTTVSLVGLDPEGVPAYAFHSTECADTGISPTDVPTLGPEVTGLHFGSYSIAVSPTADAVASLTAQNTELFISLDPNIRATVEPDLDVWKTRIAAFFPHVNVLKVSQEDLDILHPDVSTEDFASGAIGAGAELVVITDGGDRVRGYTATGHYAEATPPKIDVVDTVGAGDTFMACLLHLLSNKSDPISAIADFSVASLTEALQTCATAAAITSTRRGADLPRMDDLRQFLKG